MPRFNMAPNSTAENRSSHIWCKFRIVYTSNVSIMCVQSGLVCMNRKRESSIADGASFPVKIHMVLYALLYNTFPEIFAE